MLFFRFSLMRGYYRIMNIVPCAVQQVLVVNVSLEGILILVRQSTIRQVQPENVPRVPKASFPPCPLWVESPCTVVSTGCLVPLGTHSPWTRRPELTQGRCSGRLRGSIRTLAEMNLAHFHSEPRFQCRERSVFKRNQKRTVGMSRKDGNSKSAEDTRSKADPDPRPT